MAASPQAGADQQLTGATLFKARLLAGSMTAGLLAFLAISGLVELPEPFGSRLVPVAALAGLLSPVLGYRTYELLRGRVAAGSSRTQRCQLFVKANLIAFAITEGAGFFGLVVFLMTEQMETLIGVVTHVILVGALWPTPERLERFLDTGDLAERKG